MYPAVRFDRFRRFEHQVFWPYLGKKAIQPACRTAIVNSSAFTDTLQRRSFDASSRIHQAASPLFRSGRPLAAPVLFGFTRALSVFIIILRAATDLLAPLRHELREPAALETSRPLPPETPVPTLTNACSDAASTANTPSKVQMVSARSPRKPQYGHPATELCRFFSPTSPRSCTLSTNSDRRKLT